MAKRIAKNTVIVRRDDKEMKIEAGQEFDFTPAEIKDLDGLGVLQAAPAPVKTKSAE